MLEALFSPEAADTAAEFVGGASDISITGLALWVAYKIVRLCEAGKEFLEAQTKAVQSVTKSVETVRDVAKEAGRHMRRTSEHQSRLEAIFESAA